MQQLTFLMQHLETGLLHFFTIKNFKLIFHLLINQIKKQIQHYFSFKSTPYN